MDKQVIDCIEKSILCWLATADVGGFPSVSPKEIFTYTEPNQLMIANIASPGSKKNILQNEKVCVSIVDVLVQKGFKLYGVAKVVDVSGLSKNPAHERLLCMAGPFKFAEVFVLTIEKAKPILAPSYLFNPNMTEKEQIEKAKVQYGLNIK